MIRSVFRFSFLRHGIGAALAVALTASAPAAETAANPRIISLYAAHTEILLRLGARDNIIGVSGQESYNGPETVGWDPPVFSIRDDVEKFLAAKPDIILARRQHVAGAGHLVAALERAGIRVIAMQVVRADGLYDYWRELGALVGREIEAEAMVTDFDATVQRYREAAESMSSRPGVFVEAVHRGVKTFTPDSLPAWLVELAGGRYLATDAKPTVYGVIIADYGPERLLARAAEIDIFISQEGAMNRVPLEEVKKRSIYQPLRATREGRVYKIPESILARPTPGLLQGLEILAGWTGLLEAVKHQE